MIESSADSASAAPVSAGNQDEPDAEPGSGEDNLTERPRGWCFKTWRGPEGRWLAVSPPGEPTHELRSDSRVVWNGSGSARLGTEKQRVDRFSGDVMWQTIDATPYRGSRIELSVQFRGPHGSAQLFLRTQRATERELVLAGSGPGATLWFGHSDASWWRLWVIGDVPVDADVIVFGVAVHNGGHLWIDDARLTKVSTSTRLTDNPIGANAERFTMPLTPGRPFDVPTNLDFEATDLDSAGLSSSTVGC